MSDLVDYLRDKLEHADDKPSEPVCRCTYSTTTGTYVRNWIGCPRHDPLRWPKAS